MATKRVKGSYTMARRNELARNLGYDSYTDRQKRQRFYKATGDKSVLPAGVDPKKLRTTVAAIPDKEPTKGSLRASMDRLKIRAGSVPVTPVTVRGNARGTVANAGNVSKSVVARAGSNPDAEFQLTYVVKTSQGEEWTMTITKTGQQWADWIASGKSIDDAIEQDMSDKYSGGSWAASVSNDSPGSFSIVG